MYFTCFKQKDMKISKSGLLNLSLVFTVLGLWLVAVSMAQRQLYVDLNNAAQYMEKVKFISTWSNDSAFLEQIGDGSVKIQTNNFILSRTWSDENIISGAYYSSILWWIKNKIEWKIRKGTNVIIGWSENLINSEYNVILWWKWNQIENWKYSVILWWKDNNLSWDYSVILWSDNKLEGSQSTVVWKSGYVKGNYSAALWTNSKVEANNSFLWTDGSTTETLTGDNLFVIMAGSGMIINNNVAHRFAKLTIWWPLIVSSKNTDENIQCGTWKGWWILKIKNAGSQMCLCSCNGSWRNSMLGKGKCMGICDSSIKPECGNDVQRIKVWNFIEYSWSCIFGRVVKWTWAYLVTKDDKVHWSCQTDDGQTIGCSGTATGYPYRSCWGSHPTAWVIVWSSVYVEVNWIKAWYYTSGSTPWVCEYTCDTSKGYHWNGEMCVNTYECIWDQPWENTTRSTVVPTWWNKSWTYRETWALWACEWRCKSSNYERDWLTMNCKPKTYACQWTMPWAHTKTWSNVTTQQNQQWEYTWSSTPWACEWTCIDWYKPKSDGSKSCEPSTYICTWTAPWLHTTRSTVAPTWSNKSWTYRETWTLWACEWRCENSDYERDWDTMNCKPKTYACQWTMPWAHTKTWSNVTTQQNQQWEYVNNPNPWVCEWACEDASYYRVPGSNYCAERVSWICSLTHFNCEWWNPSEEYTWSDAWTWKCWDAECKECREDNWYYLSGWTCELCTNFYFDVHSVSWCVVNYHIAPYTPSWTTLNNLGLYYSRNNTNNFQYYYYGLQTWWKTYPGAIVWNWYAWIVYFRIKDNAKNCFGKITSTEVETQSCWGSTSSCTCANRKTFHDRNCLNWKYDILYSSNRTEIATISTSGVSGNSSNYFGKVATCNTNSSYTDTSCNIIGSNLCCCQNSSDCRLSTNWSSPMACPQKYYFFGNSRQLYQTISNKVSSAFAGNPTLYIPSTEGQWCRIKLKYITTSYGWGGTYYVEESTKLWSLQC